MATKTIDEIHEAFSKIHRRASGQSQESYMSIPADPERDADLIVGAAINELGALRSTLAAKEAEIERVRSDFAELEAEHTAALATARARMEELEKAETDRMEALRAHLMSPVESEISKRLREARWWRDCGNRPHRNENEEGNGALDGSACPLCLWEEIKRLRLALSKSEPKAPEPRCTCSRWTHDPLCAVHPEPPQGITSDTPKPCPLKECALNSTHTVQHACRHGVKFQWIDREAKNPCWRCAELRAATSDTPKPPPDAKDDDDATPCAKHWCGHQRGRHVQASGILAGCLTPGCGCAQFASPATSDTPKEGGE